MNMMAYPGEQSKWKSQQFQQFLYDMVYAFSPTYKPYFSNDKTRSAFAKKGLSIAALLPDLSLSAICSLAP
jgi:hypothetical protein